jgi:hypothetical protein
MQKDLKNKYICSIDSDLINPVQKESSHGAGIGLSAMSGESPAAIPELPILSS